MRLTAFPVVRSRRPQPPKVLAIFGGTRAGRPLLALVWLDRDGFDHLIVGARELTGEELVMFERWEEGR